MSSLKTAEFSNAIGARIRHARIAARLSQTALGDALGVSFQQVQKYELGKDRVSAEALARIATVLEWPVAEFFANSPEVVQLPSRSVRERMQISDAISRLDPEVRRRVMALVEALAPAEAAEPADERQAA